MNIITYIYSFIDSFLMPFIRLPDEPIIGYCIGLMILSAASVIIGELSISIAFRANKSKISRDNNDIKHFQHLSLQALQAGDKAAYKACNSIANDAFGQSFFSQITLSAASLWPLFIALGWMEYRFQDVEFVLPFSLFGVQLTVGYFLIFLICYIITRIVFGLTKKHLMVRSCHV